VRRGLGIALALGAAAVAMTLLSAVPPHAQAGAPGGGDQYLSPSEMAFSPDGRLLYVVCERSDQLLVLNAKEGVVLQRIRVGHVPRTVAISPDGRLSQSTSSCAAMASVRVTSRWRAKSWTTFAARESPVTAPCGAFC